IISGTPISLMEGNIWVIHLCHGVSDQSSELK
ncbi:unnamed protein product, partial [marine sediment metagenome]